MDDGSSDNTEEVVKNFDNDDCEDEIIYPETDIQNIKNQEENLSKESQGVYI